MCTQKNEVGFLDRKKVNSILIKTLRHRLENAGLINSGVYEENLLIVSYQNKEKFIQNQYLFSKY